MATESLCEIVGIKELKLSPDKPKLDEKLRKRGTKNIKDKYLLGQNIVKDSIPDIASFLLERDYHQIANFTGIQDLYATFVPEGYIPHNPEILDQECNDLIQYSFPTYKKKNIGDVAEKEAYFALRDYFENKEETVVIIHGLEMHPLDKRREKNAKSSSREIDFLIINYTHHYIMDIEVKNFLGTEKMGKKKNAMSSMDKARTQIEQCKSYIEEWFGADLSPNWKFIGAVFYKHLQKDISFPEYCEKFIFGKADFHNKMKLITKEMLNEVKPSTDEFKILLKYIFYCSPVHELPLAGNYQSVVQKSIDKAASAENIKLWCFPTPKQRMIFDYPKLIFASPWGSGKTLMMTSKAIELAEKNEKVLFLLFNNGDKAPNDIRPLLALDLEEKFKNYSNVNVKDISYIDGKINNLMELTKGYQHLMIDEFFDDFHKLKGENQAEVRYLIQSKDIVWMALSNFYYGEALDGPDNMDQLFKGWFPDMNFKMAEMKMPLRMSSNVAKELKSHCENQKKLAATKNVFSRTSKLYLNSKLFAESTLPSNLTEGCKIKRIGNEKIRPLTELLHECFKLIPNQFAMIIINDDGTNKVNKKIRSMIHCHEQCKRMINVITIDVALENVGRPCPKFHCIDFTNGEQEVKEWISGNRQQDLVVSKELIKGFEHDLIVDLTGGFNEIFSRASAQIIQLCPNPLLDMLSINKLLSSHLLMSRVVRHKWDFTKDSAIGELHLDLTFLKQNRKYYIDFLSYQIHIFI